MAESALARALVDEVLRFWREEGGAEVDEALPEVDVLDDTDVQSADATPASDRFGHAGVAGGARGAMQTPAAAAPLTSPTPSPSPTRVQKWAGVATETEIFTALRQYDVSGRGMNGTDLAIASTLLVKALSARVPRSAAGRLRNQQNRRQKEEEEEKKKKHKKQQSVDQGGSTPDAEADNLRPEPLDTFAEDREAVRRMRRFLQRRVADEGILLEGGTAVRLYIAWKRLGWLDAGAPGHAEGAAAGARLQRLTTPLRARSFTPGDYQQLLTCHVQMSDRTAAVGLLSNPFRVGCWTPAELANICHAHAVLRLGRDFAPVVPPSARVLQGRTNGNRDAASAADTADLRSALHSSASPGLPPALEAEVCRTGFTAATSGDVAQCLWSVSKLRVPHTSPVYQTAMEWLARHWVARDDVVKVIWALAHARVSAPGVFAFALPFAPKETAVDYSQLLWAYATARVLSKELFEVAPPSSVLAGAGDMQLATMAWAYGKASAKENVRLVCDRVTSRTSLAARASMAITCVGFTGSHPKFVRELPTHDLSGRHLAELAVAAYKARNTMFIGRIAGTLKDTNALSRCGQVDLLALKGVFTKPPLCDTIAKLLKRVKRR